MSTRDNKAVIQRYFDEVHNRGSLAPALLGQIVDPDLHERVRVVSDALRTAFPDYRLTLLRQIAEDDAVATVWVGQGTHRGVWASPLGPIAATGKLISVSGMNMLRLEAGKIIEIIGSNWDEIGILQQMGALPAATEPPAS